MLQLWRFFPQFRDFRATLGSSSLLRNFSFIPRLHFWCCPFCSTCLFSSLSPPVASLVCFSCWPPSLFVRMWLWGPAWCSFLFVPPVYPSSHLLRGKEGCQICVSSLRFGSGLYVEAEFLGGKHLGYAGRDLAVVPCWWSLYLCVGFFLWRRSCVSSPPAGGGVGSFCASFGVTAQRFPGAPAVFRSVSCNWLPFWGSTPS